MHLPIRPEVSNLAHEDELGVAPDGRSFVVVGGHGTGTSDVVVADGLLTSTANGGQK